MKDKKRILAWAGLLLFAALLISLVVLTFTGGSENTILAILFCLVVLPVMLYGYQMTLRFLKKRNQDK